jgi:hypothetical protein
MKKSEMKQRLLVVGHAEPLSCIHQSKERLLLKTLEAAEFLSLSPRTLEALRLKGGGPPYIQVTSKSIRYRVKDLQDWIEERRCTSSSDPNYNSINGAGR